MIRFTGMRRGQQLAGGIGPGIAAKIVAKEAASEAVAERIGALRSCATAAKKFGNGCTRPLQAARNRVASPLHARPRHCGSLRTRSLPRPVAPDATPPGEGLGRRHLR